MPADEVPELPDVSVIILTRGDRPTELNRAVASVEREVGIGTEVVLVINGAGTASPVVVSDGPVVGVDLPENLGIPGGRNVGARYARGELLAFLDDDAHLLDDGVMARCADAFAADGRLGALALRIVDEDGHTARRHVPRLGGRHPERSRPVTAFLGGAVVIRRRAFADAGGYDADFFYAMEETDLALRLLDRGWSIAYDGRPAVFHPHSEPSRHDGAARHTMRNRLWLAHRNLPMPLAVAYVANWLVIASLRRPGRTGANLAGLAEGWRTRRSRPRAPISWRTVGQMTRLGRPPIV